MKLNKYDYLFFISLGIMIVGMISAFFSYNDTHIEYVNCYDANHNVIKGIFCEEEVPNSRTLDIIYKIGVLAFVPAFFFMVMGIISKIDEDYDDTY